VFDLFEKFKKTSKTNRIIVRVFKDYTLCEKVKLLREQKNFYTSFFQILKFYSLLMLVFNI